MLGESTESSIKVTYLLGAGASALALPTVKDQKNENGTIVREGFAKSFVDLAEYLEEQHSELSPEYTPFNQQLIEGLKWLGKKSDEFETVDTYAKYCFLKSDTDPEFKIKLNRLKRTLSLFFIIKQLLKKKFDRRYLTFLTTILNNGREFPEEVKILSWNYDYQLQIAAKNFRVEEYSGSDHKPPLINYYPSVGVFPSLTAPSLIHLNGIAGFTRSVSAGASAGINTMLLDASIERLVQVYDQYLIDEVPILNFAWETVGVLGDSEIEHAKKAIVGTNILVVIGYSFPYFNREFDREIFKALKEENNFTRIYFQDPHSNGQFLYNQFGLDKNVVDIEWVEKCEQLYIPNEL